MATKTVLETLEAARKRIELPEHWTKGFYARNANGRLASYDSPEAACWCAEGALLASGASIGSAALNALWKVTGNLIGFNDTHAHAEVLAAFDAAIAAERLKEAK